MKLFPYFGLGLVMALALAGCGEPERVRPVVHARPARAGGEFDELGTVTLYPGESCASQVVFVFHAGGAASISLAAPFRQSEVLKDAVRSHRKVRVAGKWRRGKTPDCTYVEATQVDVVQKSFW